ncbi:hypothetical protein C1645_778420 [Glomus cerebriforme]|uniref:Uncharacterized protein n=1 Tax=Glomus cerebriforme TaxID=658196 RepID=A0A397SSD6_9GLOM|nr:hypothetical protein C1645_778420 [Glomus cerebriforme]
MLFKKIILIYIMSHKKLIVFVNIILILVFLSTSTYSAPHDTIDTIEHDLNIIEEQDMNFFCQDGTSTSCCPPLAHRVASKHHSRCASIILNNKSGYNMSLSTINLEDGRWVTSKDDDDGYIEINCEPHSLLNGESEAMSSVTSHFLGGVKGYVIFTMDDDISSNFIISWEVPTIGSPGYFFNFLDKPSRNKYVVKYENSFGNTVFQVTISPEIPWTTQDMLPFFFPFFIFIPCCCCIPLKNGEQQYNSFRQQERQSFHPYEQQRRQSYNSFGQQNKQFYNYNNVF